MSVFQPLIPTIVTVSHEGERVAKFVFGFSDTFDLGDEAFKCVVHARLGERELSDIAAFWKLYRDRQVIDVVLHRDTQQLALRCADPVPAFVLVPYALHESLLADKVADRMLGAAGVKHIDSINAHDQHVRSQLTLALAHINRTRVCVQRPLDPAAAGWTAVDVFVEAYRLGWEP